MLIVQNLELLFSRFPRARARGELCLQSHCRSIFREHRERSYSRCGILNARHRETESFERGVVHKPRSPPLSIVDGLHQETDVTGFARDRLREQARSIAYGIACFSINGGRYFGEVLDILFNSTSTQMQIEDLLCSNALVYFEQ